jgi:GNAT superfamily N-acetyltransferase
VQTDGVADVRIRPITPATFRDLDDVFGTRGDASSCWCQWYLTTGNAFSDSVDSNRAALRGQVASAGHTVGLVAYAVADAGDAAAGPSDGAEDARDDELERAVGWVQVGPRPSFPRITGNRELKRLVDDLDDESVWAVTCFVVRVGHRRKGVGRALLDEAVAEARRQGATALVGHPVDVAAGRSKVGGSDLYHGAATTFEAAGFEVVGRTGPSRPVMRLDL